MTYTSFKLSIAAGCAVSMLGAGSALASSYLPVPCPPPRPHCVSRCTYTPPCYRPRNYGGSCGNRCGYGTSYSYVSPAYGYNTGYVSSYPSYQNNYGYGYSYPSYRNSSATTSVNSTINATSSNHTNIDQVGGWNQSAAVSNDADTTVNSTINAGSSNY